MENMKEISVNVNGIGGMVVIASAYAQQDGKVPADRDLVLTSGEDGVLYITDLTTEQTLHNTVMSDGPIPSFAVTPEQTHVIVVQEDDNAVYSYVLPTQQQARGVMEKLLFRSTVTIRQVVCTKKYIAIADEDTKIKVLLRAATDEVIAIDGHDNAIKSITIDPSEQFLCSSSEDGTVRVFKLNDQTRTATQVALFHVQYKDIRDEEVLCRCAWQPGDKDTGLLAVPVHQGIIELYNRSSWKSSGQIMLPIGKDYTSGSDINIVEFSPNGAYIAAATLAKEVFVWKVANKALVRSFKVEYMVLSLQWALTQNALVVYHTGGKFGFVKDVIHAGMELPYHSTAANFTSTTSTSGIHLPSVNPTKVKTPSKLKASSFIDDEAGEDNYTMGDDEDDEEFKDDDNEARVEAIKASFGFGQATATDAAGYADSQDDYSGATKFGSRHTSFSASSGVVIASPFKTITEPFVPGSVQDGSVSLLAWTPIGEIESIRGANLSENLVKVEFADKSRRGFKFNDNYMFSMACLDDNGAFFGVPRRVREEWEVDANGGAGGENGDIISSFVFYRPFDSWASNSSWHLGLPEGEDAECVAAAAEFCAVATSLHSLRIYTTSGLEYALIRLPGRIVTMTAKKSLLAIVYQSVFGQLEYQLLRIRVDSSPERVKQLTKGILPMTPPSADVFASHKENELAREDAKQWSTLSWLGFDDRLVLYAVDSFGCVQALSQSVGWNWFPIGVVGNTLNKKPEDRHGIFTLGVANDSLLYFPLEKGMKAPKLRGKHRPIPSTFVLHTAAFPKTVSKSKKVDAETNIMWQNVRLFGLESSQDEGDDAANKIVHEQAEMDKALILMMKTACTNDESARVLDLAKCLHLEKSHQIAQKLAIHFGLRQLQNQLYELYRVKFEQVQHDDFEQEQYNHSLQREYHQPQRPARGVAQPLHESSQALLSRKKTPVEPISHPRSAPEESSTSSLSSPPATEKENHTDSSKDVLYRSTATTTPVKKPVIERSVAPVNPFLKKPSASGDGGAKSGLERLAKFTPPPSSKRRKV